MLTVHPEYLVDAAQTRKAILISVTEWEQIIEELEELDDIREYNAAKSNSDEVIPFTQAMYEIETGMLV